MQQHHVRDRPAALGFLQRDHQWLRVCRYANPTANTAPHRTHNTTHYTFVNTTTTYSTTTNV